MIGEVLPNVTRSMTYRLTARDNRMGGGGVNSASVTFNVTTAAGPFQVTAPNTANTEVSWIGLTSEAVTWNVANTTAAPVSCAAVDISLSTDGGLTYPTALASNTPNDGTETIVVPNINTTTARVRVSCAGNIFFDISNANFSITAVPVAVALASFAAEAQANQVLVTWETVSEINNAGFNLYRGLSADGSDRTLLVSIPSQAPGSSQGAGYSYGDTAVQAGQTYYYWLESIDLNGVATMHLPVSVVFTVPTAVTLNEMAASPMVDSALPTVGAMLVMLLLLASGLVVAQQRRA